MTSRFLPEWLGRAGTGFVEGEGVESFCLRDAGFKILVRNGNVDIQEAVENSHLAFGERLGLERNSGIIRKLGALTSVRRGQSFLERGAGNNLSALSPPFDAKGHESRPLSASCVAGCQYLACSRCSINAHLGQEIKECPKA